MPELSGSNYSELDASNSVAAPNGMPEGMPPSGVNDAWRAGMGAIVRFWDRIQGKFASTGSANAYVLTPTVALAAYVTGERYSFRANFANTGAATLNISALGAKTIKKMTAATGKADLASGDIQNGQPVTVEYDGTDLVMATPIAVQASGVTSVSNATNGGINVVTGTSTPVLNIKPSDLVTKATLLFADSVILMDSTATTVGKTGTMSALSAVQSYYLATETATSGTDGPTFSSTTWNKRTLVEVTDTNGIASISSGTITLAAGTYIARAWGKSYLSNGNMIRLQNTSDTATILLGSSEFADSGASTTTGSLSVLNGRFTIAGSKSIELQHWTTVGGTKTGGRAASSGSTEMYSLLELIQVA